MSKKTNEIVHWTIQDESRILEAIPAIREESGKYFLSAKSDTYLSLRKEFSSRTDSAFHAKVREMLKSNAPQPSRTLFSFDEEQSELPEPPTTICDAVDRILREFYGEVDYNTFIRFQEHLSKFQ